MHTARQDSGLPSVHLDLSELNSVENSPTSSPRSPIRAHKSSTKQLSSHFKDFKMSNLSHLGNLFKVLCINYKDATNRSIMQANKNRLSM
jgi:hypothetical protein